MYEKWSALHHPFYINTRRTSFLGGSPNHAQYEEAIAFDGRKRANLPDKR